MQSVIVHYQEIALKGKNRPWFIAKLVRNLRTATADLDVRSVRVLMGRIEMVLGPDAQWEVVRERLSRVFGVGNFAKAGRAPLEIEAMAAHILADLGDLQCATFRVSARRADKRFPLTSPETRARGGRTDQGGPGLDGQPRASRADHSSRGADRRSVLFLRQGSRRRRPAGRAPAARSSACCRAASTRRLRRGG